MNSVSRIDVDYVSAYQLNAVLRSGEKYTIAYDVNIFSLAHDMQDLAKYLGVPYYEHYTEYCLSGMNKTRAQ